MGASSSGTPSRSTVGRIESGQIQPRINLFARLVEAGGCRLAVVAAENPEAPPAPYPWEDLRDRGHRHYPAHLDIRTTDGFHGWWGDLGWTGRERPDYTFSRWHPDRQPRQPPP